MALLQKIYSRINWKNNVTPINQDNLNKMDKAIDDLDTEIVGLSQKNSDMADEIANLSNKIDDTAGSLKEDITTELVKLENTLADGIVCEASGKFINVKDASNKQVVSLIGYGMSEQETYTGKNLWAYGDVSGTQSKLITLEKPIVTGQYCLSFIATSTDIDHDTSIIQGRDSTDATVFTITAERDSRKSYVINANNDIEKIHFYASHYNTASSGDTFAFTDIQLESGAVATDFEKYVGGTASPNADYTQPINSIGDSGNLDLISKNKNYLEYPYVDTTKTVNGITFTDNRDGTVTVNGTATGTATFKLGYIEFPANNGSEFILNGCPSGGSGTTYMLQESDYDNLWGHMGIEYGAGRQIGNIHNSKCQIAIVIGNGAIINDLTFKPMLRLATDTDNTYVPYQGNKVTITSGLPLRGLQASSDGNVMIDNQRYWADILVKYADGTGEVIKRFRERIFDGTENWGDNTNSKGYVITRSHYDPDVKVESNAKSIALCTHYIKSANLWEDGKFGISDGTLWVGDVNFEDYGSLADFKAFLAKEKANGNPFKVLYQLATPERIPLTATELQSLEALHTFKPISNIYNSDGGYMDVEYVADTKIFIQNAVTEVATALIATASV